MGFEWLVAIVGVLALASGIVVRRVDRSVGGESPVTQRNIDVAADAMGGSAERRARELRFMRNHERRE